MTAGHDASIGGASGTTLAFGGFLGSGLGTACTADGLRDVGMGEVDVNAVDSRDLVNRIPRCCWRPALRAPPTTGAPTPRNEGCGGLHGG